MKKQLVKFAIAILMLMPVSQVSAELVINEVLSNEPGSSTTLEWIEIFNNSSFLKEPLGLYQIRAGATTIRLPNSDTLDGGEYYIVCSRLFASGSTPGFESYWGDNSGFWGDTEYEQSLKRPFDIPFSLSNNGGLIELQNLFNQTVSEFAWTESGIDGYSWERVTPRDDRILQSADFSGSTPGFLNSVTVTNYDLGLDSVTVLPIDGGSELSFYLTNRGVTPITDGSITLSTIVTGGFEVPFDELSLPQIDVGFSLIISESYAIDGLYQTLKATLPPDDRARNDSLKFVAAGSSYPPIIINEIMAAPTIELGTEWVEIKNVYNEAIDLKDWQIGDNSVLRIIDTASLVVAPGEYMVLAADSNLFEFFYTSFDGRLHEPEMWSLLNNDVDQVRLVDNYSLLADRHAYDDSYGDNITIARGEEEGLFGFWGRSEEVGGSPGRINSILIEPSAEGLRVEINPTHISPNGDGFEDETEITIEAPQAESYKIRIYDKVGRLIKTFANDETLLKPAYRWDGRDDAGNRVPIGIYILHCEAVGVESVKKVLVVAR